VQKKEKINFVGIGIFIFLGIVLFGFIIFFAGKYGYQIAGGYKLNIVYKFVNNLSPGQKVSIAGGMQIGSVDEIRLEGDHLVASIKIEGKYKINREATFHIFSTSLVGMQYININNYNPDSAEFYNPDEYIRGNDPFEMSSLMEMFGNALGSSMTSTNGQDVLTKLGKMFQDVGELIGSLNDVVQKSQKNVESTLKNLDAAMASTAVVMKKLEDTSDKLNQLTAKVADAVGAVDKEKITSIVGNLDSAMEDLKKFSTTLNDMSKDKSGALSLLKDKEVTEKLRSMIMNLEEFSKILKNNPNAIIFGK
jgi:ABC-type transporter Mla subunit MlaD